MTHSNWSVKSRRKLGRALVLASLLSLPMATVVHATTKKSEKVNLSDVKQVKRQKSKQTPVETRMTRNEAFLVATETRLLSEINKAIAYLSKTATRMPKKSTARLEMREKLINLRLEAAVYHANQEMRRYDRAWEAWDRGGRRGTEPKVNDSRSKGQWAALAQDGQNLLAEYPRSKNADNTIFNIGLAQNFLGNEKEAARTFSQLISKYPNSQKAGDAYFALGDFYFERTDFRNAMNNYKNALRFKQAKSYNWSLFKLGWCSYNLGAYNQALAYWKQTVAEAGRGGKKGLALKDEAMRDMVYAFAELRQVEPAIAYYRRNGGSKYIGRFLLLLSQTLSDQGRYNESIKVLKRFQQVEPNDEGGPDTQKEIISLNYELGRFSNVWAELARFPAMYGPGSRWASANASNKKLVLETQQLVKDQILYYAKLTHKNSQKDDNRRGYAEAMRGYTLFLKSYPRAKEVAEVKYLMADIQYFNKNFREAGKLYLDIGLMGKARAVVFDPKSGKPRSIHKETSEYMLDSYASEFDPELKVLLKQKPDFKKPPRPISENARNFIKACSYYARWYPNEKKNIKTCDVGITEIYYRSNDKKNSMRYLWLLAKKYPGSKEGNEAVDQLIPLYQDDKRGLDKVLAELRKIPAYGPSTAIGKKIAALEYGNEIDLAKGERNTCKRAERFEALYKKNPKSKDAEALVYNAGQDYLKCGEIPKAITAFMVVLRSHPRSAGAQPALLTVAQLQENRFELGAAAGMYAEYAKRYPKDGKAVGAMAKSCELQAAIGASSALSTCLAFAKADAEGAKLVVARMLRAAFSSGDQGRLASLVRTYDSSFRLTPTERIVAYSMIFNSAGGRGGAAQQAAQTILQTFQKAGGNVEGEALRAVGGLAFRQVNGEINKYLALKLSGGTVDALAASIQRKAQGLAGLQQAYGQVLSTKDAYWGVAALYQLGYAHEALAEALENPPGITGAKIEDVQKELAPQAKAARGEAQKFYKLALDSVEKFMVYNEWAAKALSGMARNSGKNVNFDDLIVHPDFVGAEVSETVAREVSMGGD